jgi:alpha-L-rhamnosidase
MNLTPSETPNMNASTSSEIVWKAQWLLSPAVGGPRTVPPAGYLRREFTVTGAVQRAVLHITALGLYECEINGRRIGDQVFAPGWTDYRKRVFFQSYDVTAELRDGANVMGVILGDGWYSGFAAQVDRQFYGDRPRLLAQLEITGADGRVTCLGTDTAWTTSLGPIMENDLLMGETYDACREWHGRSSLVKTV